MIDISVVGSLWAVWLCLGVVVIDLYNTNIKRRFKTRTMRNVVRLLIISCWVIPVFCDLFIYFTNWLIRGVKSVPEWFRVTFD